MTESFLYWLFILPSIARNLCLFSMLWLIFVGIIGGVIFGFLFTELLGEYEKRIWRGFYAFVGSLILSICLIIGSFFVPTTNQLIAIYAVPKIMNNEQIQSISKKSLDRIEEAVSKKEDQKLDALLEFLNKLAETNKEDSTNE